MPLHFPYRTGITEDHDREQDVRRMSSKKKTGGERHQNATSWGRGDGLSINVPFARREQAVRSSKEEGRTNKRKTPTPLQKARGNESNLSGRWENTIDLRVQGLFRHRDHETQEESKHWRGDPTHLKNAWRANINGK